MPYRPLIKANPRINWDFSNVNKIIPTVNNGGCGWFAYYLGQEIKKRYNIEPQFIFLGRGKLLSSNKEIKDIITNSNSIVEIKTNGIDLCHIMTFVNGKVIDSTGIYTSHKNSEWCYCNKLTKVNKEELHKFINLKEGWNSMFSRKRTSLAILKKEIQRALDSANMN